MKHKLKRRLDILEEKTSIDESNNVFLSHPPENNMYRVQQIFPVTKTENEYIFTQSEYELFLKDKDSNQLLEIRWTDTAEVRQ